MKVESCRILNSLFCIWFESAFFQVKDVEAQRILKASKSQLFWFIEAIMELTRRSVNELFLQNGSDDCGRTSLSKSKVEAGWIMRCTVRPRKGGGISFMCLWVIGIGVAGFSEND